MTDFRAIRPIWPGMAGRYVRNGVVVCYRVRPDGGKSGWQAKYFDRFDNSQGNRWTTRSRPSFAYTPAQGQRF